MIRTMPTLGDIRQRLSLPGRRPLLTHTTNLPKSVLCCLAGECIAENGLRLQKRYYFRDYTLKFGKRHENKHSAGGEDA